MIDINELRRLAQAATPGPWHATKSVETNSWAVWSDTTRLMELRPTKTVDMYRVSNTAAFIAAANPAAITELFDRLEAAESDALEQARLNGMGGEREAALMAKLEAAEKERDALRAALRHEADCVEAAKAEIAALRVKVERMERQEPTGKFIQHPSHGMWEQDGYGDNPDAKPLYALPGAQPKPSMPIDSIGKLLTQAMDVAVANGANSVSMPDELVEVAAWLSGAQPAPSVPEDVMRDAERYRYLRARDDGTAGVGCWIEANGRVCDRGWLYGVQLDSAIDSFIEVLAAAPKPEGE